MSLRLNLLSLGGHRDRPGAEGEPRSQTASLVLPMYFLSSLPSSLHQAAQFLASEGALVTRPQPEAYVEMPILLPLPETLNGGREPVVGTVKVDQQTA